MVKKEDIDKLRLLLSENDTEKLVEFFNGLGIKVTNDLVYDNFDIPMQEFTSMIEKDEEILAYLRTKPHENISDFVDYFQREDISKEFIDNRKKYGLTINEVVSLAVNIKDSKYIQNLTIDLFPELSAAQAIDLVKNAHDSKFCKYLIETFRLTDSFIAKLAPEIDDFEYLKGLVFEVYDPECKAQIVSSTQNLKFMKTVVENYDEYEFESRIEIIPIIIATNDKPYMKEMIQSFLKPRAYGTGIAAIALGINEPDYTKSLIEEYINYFNTKYNLEETENPYTNYAFSSEDLTQLLISVKDPKYIKKILEEDKYPFMAARCIEAIAATEDDEFIKKRLEYLKKYNDIYNLDGKSFSILLKAIKNPEYVKKYIEERKASILESQTVKEITLPENMTVGIEIESEYGIHDWDGLILPNWSAHRDASLIEGIEVVSPILKGSTHSVEEIYETCAGLEASHHLISDNCGGHVHIGADYLTSAGAYKNLIEIWSNAEKVLYTICNEAGEPPREDVTYYAPPISKKMEDAITSGEIDLVNEEDLENFVTSMKQIQGNKDTSRYSGINFKNTLKKNKNTIEFRLSNGTLDPDVWVENVNLYGGIVKAAEELAQIQQKSSKGLTPEEMDKLNIFDCLSDEYARDEDKLEFLLELVIKPEQRDIYRTRYKENSKLLEERRRMELELEGMITKNPLRISDVVSATLVAGPNQVVGSDYFQVEGDLNKRLKSEQEQFQEI